MEPRTPTQDFADDQPLEEGEVLTITYARVVGPHSLFLRFNNGTTKQVNLESELWGEVFEPLRDPAFFAQARLDDHAGTVVWPNDADFAPEALHDLPAEQAEYAEQERVA